MIVIADTSPINYLILIGKVELLRELFGIVSIPSGVRDEMLRAGAPEDVCIWMEKMPEWVQVRTPSHVLSIEGLDSGEMEAIALAKEMKADLLLVDDGDTRNAARAEGIVITGTLGVLELAARRNLVDLEKTLKELRERTNFRLSDALVNAAIRRMNLWKTAKTESN